METSIGAVPRIADQLRAFDRLGTVFARLGVSRHRYMVAPGLYAVGRPDSSSPVLVTANYKMSFDLVRFNLRQKDVWLLVLDTCGINVWCAAGKGTFSTRELVHRVRLAGLDRLVSHRLLIVPQLGATGVAAHEVKKQCGFTVRFGPVRATDIAGYLDNGCRSDESARQVTFSMKERLELIPVEFYQLGKTLLWLIPLLYLISGFGPGLYSLERAVQRGTSLLAATGVGIVGGLIVVPTLLPWLPGRLFAVKGALVGLAGGLLLLGFTGSAAGLAQAALLLFAAVTSSYCAMNFTGSTPFTSPSGVEWEMKRAIPLQLLAAAVTLVIWVAAPWMGRI